MARDRQYLSIAELYPYEVSGASGKVARHVRTIKRGEEIEPVEVLEIDGEYLVVDGTNRVLAAKQCGLTDVAVEFAFRQQQEIGQFHAALEEARRANRKGFENTPVGGQGERADEYRESQPSTIDGLLKRLNQADADAEPPETP
jgi:hypothetical protein